MNIVIRIKKFIIFYFYIGSLFEFSLIGVKYKYLFSIYFDDTIFILDFFFKEIIIINKEDKKWK